MLTYERAIELLDYNRVNGKLYWKKPGPKRTVGAEPGHADHLGYRRIMINYKMYLAHRLIWLLNYKEWPAQDIDHINGNPSDNRLENLRLASHTLNMQNAVAKKNSKTGVRGVEITAQGKFILRLRGKYYGTFFTLEEAMQTKEKVLCLLNQQQNSKQSSPPQEAPPTTCS